MRAGVGEVEHEGLLFFLSSMLFNHRDRFGGEAGRDFVEFEVGCDSAGPPELSLNGRPTFGVVGVDGERGGHDGLVAADVEVGRNIGGGAYAKKGIEAAINRATAQGAFELFVLEKSEMPFPDHRGSVAAFPEHRGEGQTTFIDDGVVFPDDRLAEGETSGHEPVTREVAEWSCRVGISEF